MDKQTVKYIMDHYFHLSNDKEKLAWKHYSSSIKLEGNESPKKLEMYKKMGWLTDDNDVLNLLKDGYDNFEENTAKKILATHEDKIFFNRCPNCGLLARTPKAKQCRYCLHDWHDS
ncbi:MULTISPECIES: hypothetical protein [unclassified Arcicella]|uniref:hypothetical protein n=1 Tax=unclassified Arcicella TaxID=2644986 RepID=UPI00285725B5|nr:MULTISPECIES: hypothetical protein [unclassified Arcicella]MDR6564232.1 hypothetical protein [Arcicella sp. BE51]MDR6811521.1 hypothetical protein [Arcicella sp. BE140]MDR6823047.1 hypothetical protein [Arcicella sp. BE139]